MTERANPEVLLISSTLQTGDISTPGTYGVSAECFHGHRAEWEWIERFHTKHGKTPDKPSFRTQFPDFPLLKTTDVEYASEAVLNNHLRHALAASVKDATSLLAANKPEDALAKMRSAIHGLSDPESVRNVNVLRDHSEVFEEAARRVEQATTKGLAGIDTGFATVNDRTGGVQPGDLWITAARLGVGKAEPDDSLTLTPDGWRRHGDLSPGDRVIGSDGKPTEVIATFPQGERQVYEVEFNDGSIIRCDEEHLWNVRVGTKPWRVQTTGQIAKHLADGKQRCAVPTLGGPVQFAIGHDPEYLYDPYKLGLLLGDGCFRGSEITFSTADEELIEPFGRNAVHRSGYDYALRRMRPTIQGLGLYGAYSHEKHVPEPYLYAPWRDRLALLQGLFDTDGSVTASGGVEFSTSSEQLARDVQFLAESLGGYAHWHRRSTTHRDAYRLIVVLPPEMTPFRLARKAQAWRPRTKYQPTRTIVAVRALHEWVPMTCIAVDALDSLYVTEHCIVTHNTWMLTKMATEAVVSGKRAVFISLEQTKAQITFRLHTMLANRFGYSLKNRELMSGVNLDLNYYRGFLADLPEKVDGEFFVLDPSRGRVNPYTISSIIERLEPDIVFVDYITLMQKESDEWQGVAKLSAECKEVALTHHTPIVAAAQINRLGEGGKKPPGVDKLAQSDSIGQDADVVLTMRKFSNKARQLLLAKNRSGTDDIVFYADFDPDAGRFEEVSYEDAMALQAEAAMEDDPE